LHVLDISKINNLQISLDTKAPSSHATTTTIYGAASAVNYGHAMASSLTPSAPSDSPSVGTDNGKYAREDHSHPLQTTITGNAGTATKLATARSFITNLGSASSVYFDGSTDNSHGVTGVLGVGNGGTGASTVAEAKINLQIPTFSLSGSTLYITL
jgi:hypothetical protein